MRPTRELHTMRTISAEELKMRIKEHGIWMDWGGTRGARVVLNETDLRSADLSHISLYQGEFRGTNLQGANLRGSNLHSTLLRSANLLNADLSVTNLAHADLRGAKLDGGIVGAWLIDDAHFSPDALPWLMLRPNWAEEQARVRISN
jgi:uncharacterized protein YjbI with pentapeptide repeats